MQTRRRLLALAALGALPLSRAFAQQPGKLWRIGFLYGGSRPPSLQSLQLGMRELGYVEGKDFVIEGRFAEGHYERLSGLAGELVRMRVAVIVTAGTPAIRAAQRATNSIPIVIAATIDPVGSGLVDSLARPGGNVTGLSRNVIELTPKQIELLTAIVPKLKRLAVLVNPDNSAHSAVLKAIQTTAQRMGATVFPLSARNPTEIATAFGDMRRDRTDSVIVVIDAFFISQQRQIAQLALTNHIPAVFSDREAVQAGGLASYGQSLADFYRQAATYVDKILKGAKPGELPIEEPTRIHLAINLKTAKILRLTIPQDLLLRADEVIQ